MKSYFAFQWHITDYCDQRCQHCYIFSENDKIPLKHMSWDEIEHVLDNCLDMCVQLNREPYFYLTGGDPLLHKKLWQLLATLKERGFSFSLMGNPFHLNDETCERLKSYGCERYQMSLDGLQETHDVIRKAGSFEMTLEKISSIRQAGIKSVIMTTVSGTNFQQIPALIDRVVAHHVDVFAFARYCPTSFEKSTHMTPEEYQSFLELCWVKFEEHKNSGTIFNLKDHLWTLYLYEKGLFSIPSALDQEMIYDGCHCGISHLTILPSGEVYACRRMESQIGNALTDRLVDVFLGEKMNRYRAYQKFEKCSQCELLRFCRGCPAVAYGYTHNPYSPDPQCWKKITINGLHSMGKTRDSVDLPAVQCS